MGTQLLMYIGPFVHRPLVMSAPHKLSKHQNHGTTKLNSTATDGAPAAHTVKQDHQGFVKVGSLICLWGASSQAHDRASLRGAYLGLSKPAS